MPQATNEMGGSSTTRGADEGGPLIVFSHGNGFPAATYRRLLERWQQAGWSIAAIERFGHDPRWPVSVGWPGLVAQLADFIAQQPAVRAGRGCWLVGHSLGGVLSLMAAARHPEGIHGVVLLDSPVVAGWRAQLVRVGRSVGLLERFSPGRTAERRRHEWASRDAARTHFASKAVFADWAEGVLDDYIAAGVTTPAEGGAGARLAFDRAIEARIYDTLPHHVGSLLRRQPPRCPIGFIAGTRSREMRQGGSAAAVRLAGPRFQRIDGTHLFPMERPDETADRVLALLATMPAHGTRAA